MMFQVSQESRMKWWLATMVACLTSSLFDTTWALAHGERRHAAISLGLFALVGLMTPFMWRGMRRHPARYAVPRTKPKFPFGITLVSILLVLLIADMATDISRGDVYEWAPDIVAIPALVLALIYFVQRGREHVAAYRRWSELGAPPRVEPASHDG